MLDKKKELRCNVRERRRKGKNLARTISFQELEKGEEEVEPP